MLTEYVGRLQVLGIIEEAKAANKTQQHHPLKTGDHNQVGRRFTQHIAYSLAQGVAGVYGVEEAPPQQSVTPLQAGLILYAAPFHSFVEQCALGSENMLTADVIKPAHPQLMLHVLNINNTVLPQRVPFLTVELRAVMQADNLQPGVLQQRININGRGVTTFRLIHVRSTARNSSSGSPSTPGT